MNERKDLIRLGLVFGLAFVALAAQAQPAKAWSKIIGLTSPANNSPDAIGTDGSGNTFVAKTRGFRGTQGQSGFVEVTKLSATGAGLWTVNLLGAGSGIGRAVGMTVDNSGNPVVLQIDQLTFLTSAGPIVTKLNGATGAVLWRKDLGVFGFAAGDIGHDTAGNIFVGGQAINLTDTRMALTKLAAATGAQAWTRTIARTAPGISDTISQIAVDTTGNVALVGTARPTDVCVTTGAHPFVIGRVRGTDGAQLWATTYNNVATDQILFPHVAVDGGGNVYVGASVFRVPNSVWIFAKRSAATGAAVWGKALQPMGTILQFMTDLAVDGTGGVAGAGDAFGMSGAGVYVNRFTTAGAQSWAKLLADRSATLFLPYGHTSRRLVAVGSTSYLCSFTRDTTTSGRSTSIATITKLAVSNGTVNWDKTYNGAGTSATKPIGIAAASNGDAVITCSVETGSENYPVIQTGTNRVASANGASVFGGLSANAVIPSPDYGSKVIVDSAGNVYAVGGSLGRIITVKYNSAGTQIWQNVYDDLAVDATSSELDGGRMIARDASGNIIVGGTNRGQSVVLKISNTTGGKIWDRRTDNSFGQNLGLNAAGDVYVPIESPSGLLKITGTTGAIAWTGTMDGTGDSDEASYVVVNSTGIPFVSGKTTDSGTCSDDDKDRIMVQKFNPATGAKTWLKEITPFKVGQNAPCGIGLDVAGNVLVGGSGQGVSTLDFTAAKLNATSGAVLWNTHFDYLAWDELATAMLVDGAGNLVITGITTISGAQDQLTVKVLDSTGAKSWQSHIAAPAGRKWPYAVARDSANNIYVGGLNASDTTLTQYATKLAAATGGTTWTVLTPNGLGAINGGMGVAVSSTNRLHMVGANVGTGTSLSNMTVVQYLP